MTRTRRKRSWWIGGSMLVVAVLGGVAVWYFVFRDTAPPAVDIERAAESVDRGSTATTAGSGSSNPLASGLDGTWDVDQSIGDFDVSTNTFTSAFVGYRVNEELAGVGAKTAYGRTPDVTGSITIAGTQVTRAEFTADLTTLQSDDSRRDGQLRNQAIQTSQFPNATFALTQPIDLGTLPTDETTIKVDASGELTLHGVTRTVTIPLEAKLVDDTIVVTSLFEVQFADYGIQRPTSAAVLSIEEQGVMELQLFLTRS